MMLSLLWWPRHREDAVFNSMLSINLRFHVRNRDFMTWPRRPELINIMEHVGETALRRTKRSVMYDASLGLPASE